MSTIKVPIISPTVLQWTGASPWMDLVQRALVWEATRAGCLRQRVLRLSVRRRAGCRHDDPGDDQRRSGLAAQDRPRHGRRPPGVSARRCCTRPRCTRSRKASRWPSRRSQRGETPVVLADHSDRSGYATWLLREIIAQDLANTLIATIADARAIDELKARASRPAMPSTARSAAASTNPPASRSGSRARCCTAVEGHGQFWIASIRPRQCAGAQPLSGADHGAVLAEKSRASTSAPSR